MLKDKYIEAKAARLLRDNGFDEVSFKYYDQKDNLCNGVNINRSPITWSAPTQEVAMEWIRKTYGIHIVVDLTCNEEMERQEFYYAFKNIANGKKVFGNATEYFKKYEDCADAAILFFMERVDMLRAAK